MSENAPKKELFQLNRLRPAIHPPVAFLAQTLLDDLGDNLLSLSVVGSALTGDFHPKYSDINTVMTVKQRSHSLLKLLAGYASKMGRQKIRAPLLMTPEYIEQSCDVFGVEFLDFQFNHITVYGSDPFGALTFTKENVRLQCERQLKAALIRLRQSYIRSAGKAKLVTDLLMECVKELTVLLRALLWLVDVDRDKEVLPNLRKAVLQFQFDEKIITHLVKLQLQHARPATDQVEYLFEGLYLTIDHINRKVDEMEITK